MSNPDLQRLRAEEMRQAQVLSEVIQQAIQDASGCFRTPILNAVAGALVTVEAHILASIADPAQRKALKRAMVQSRPAALASALRAADPLLKVETVCVRERFDA